MAPGPDGTDITRLGRNTKQIPTITRGKNIWTNMDIPTNQESVGHQLGYMELQESQTTHHQRSDKNRNTRLR